LVSALKPKFDEPLSNFAFNFNLRLYTTVGWSGKKAGGRRDIYASLYEVTSRRRFPVNDTEHGTHVLNGPLSFYAASFGRGGRDFRLDSDLMGGSCIMGGSFGGPEFLIPVDHKRDASARVAKAMDVCGDGVNPESGSDWHPVRFEAWVVKNPDVDVLRPVEKAWLAEVMVGLIREVEPALTALGFTS
jgi:hypothetical protein